jgi:hypothetical protein
MKSLLFIIILTQVISNVAHMVIVRLNLFSFLKIPINEKLFGRNKTWRGIVVLSTITPLALILICLVLSFLPIAQALYIGVLLGLAYMLFELPNSWIKRRLGIGAGEKPKKYRWLFALVDKMDSSLGVSLASWWIFELTTIHAALLFFISASTHALFSIILVVFGVKSRF